MNNIWTDEELQFVLYMYLKRKEGKFRSDSEIEHDLKMMNDYCGKNRTLASIKMRMANYQFLDTGVGMSHAGRGEETWYNYHNDLDSLEENYNMIMKKNDGKEKLIKLGLNQGFVSYDDIVTSLNGVVATKEIITDYFNSLINNGVEVVFDNREWCKRSLDNYIKGKGIILSNNQKDLYIEIYLTLYELLNKKISIKDIIIEYGNISSKMKILSDKDRIRVPWYDLTEKYPLLTEEEKEEFIFTIWYSECVQIAEDDGKKFTYGINELDGVEKIKELKKEYYKKDIFHEMFHFNKIKEEFVAEGFGFSEINPIKTTSVRNAYVYLSKLKTADNKTTVASRLGSVINPEYENILDKYEIFDESKKLIGTIFIDSYSNENSSSAPKGFILD